VIFEARTKANKGCANSGNLDSWRLSRRTKHLSAGVAGVVEEILQGGVGRNKRDVREATKYIETAIIVDKAMFDKRNGSTRAEVIHDAIQVANIADLVSTTLDSMETLNIIRWFLVLSDSEYPCVGCVHRDLGQEPGCYRW